MAHSSCEYIDGYRVPEFKRIRLARAWDDLRFPAQGINPPGLGSDPDLDTATGLWLFGTLKTETLAGVAQLPHAWKEESSIHAHTHWQKTTSAAGNVLWQLDYEVVNNGDVAAMDYGSQLQTTTTVSETPDDDTAERVLISSLGEITMADTRISTLIFWKLSRIGGDVLDTYGADARLIEFDIHYQIDSLGSDLEFIKDDA